MDLELYARQLNEGLKELIQNLYNVNADLETLTNQKRELEDRIQSQRGALALLEQQAVTKEEGVSDLSLTQN